MSLVIKARGVDGDDWRIEVVNEVWEFNNTKDMEATLKKLIEFKNIYGRIDKRNQ